MEFRSSNQPGSKRWQVLPPAPDEHFAAFAGVPKLFAQLLYNRGLTDRDRLGAFLAADESLCSDPYLLPDMEQALVRLKQAIVDKEAIGVYGDFDADGTTATALLSQGFAALGARVIPYIPHRFDEGYSLNIAALEALKEQGVTMVVTVDCGVSSLKEVACARDMGLDVIITDHHTVPAELPTALAVVNPKRPGAAFGFADYSGVGVAYKLLQALIRYLGEEGRVNEQEYLDLVALGTVADIVSVLGENRYLVKQGLKVLNHTARPGLQEMVRLAGLETGGIGTSTISFALAPRLNAAGRLDHALASFRLLTTQSPEEARVLAEHLERQNAERQRLTEEAVARAQGMVQETDSPLLLLADAEFPAGVVGLVASRLAEERYCPVVIVQKGEEISRGSARSIPEFHITAALSECKDLFIRYGGHAQAAGFSIATENLPRLEARLRKIAEERLAGLDRRAVQTIDVETTLSGLAGSTSKLLWRLAPFGPDNPEPTFLTRGVPVLSRRTVGRGDRHLSLRLQDGYVIWKAIAFRQGKLSQAVTPRLDIVYRVEVDDWNGSQALQLNIQDFVPASGE